MWEAGGREVFADGADVEVVKSKKSAGESGKAARGRQELAATGVDEQYVRALEMYCLLKQRLSDVRHSWKAVVKEALADHGQHTSTYSLGEINSRGQLATYKGCCS